MEVIAFIGPPGTGKSDRALVIAYENRASCIIDDGILIYHNRIVAGTSAKKEASRLKAVRRAIFQDPQQVEDVKNALRSIRPERLLILGTSDRMVIRITDALDLPHPRRYIHIEEVARPEEIKKASESRHKEGKHVIPVPTMELTPHFRGYLVDPLKLLFHRRRSKLAKKLSGAERSVVRPVFSYYGKLTFSDKVISSLIAHAMKDMTGVKISTLSSEKSRSQTNGLILSLGLAIPGRTPAELKDIIGQVQKKVQKEIEYTTGMAVDTIRISVTTDIAR